MGYSCPVCETPQDDDEHLANHLAMTAMLHEDDHEAWLDEHIDGWGDLTPPELGKRVVADLEEIDYDETAAEQADIPDEFRNGGADEASDTTGVPETSPTDTGSPASGRDADSLDEETRKVLAEAREMTEKRRELAAEGDDSAGDSSTDEAADSDDAGASDAGPPEEE